MKKIFSILVICTSFSLAANAQTDSTRSGNYYYYPESNVYYSPSSKNYSYYDSTSSKWTTGTTLPQSYKVTTKSRHNNIRSNETDIWMDNDAHRRKYGQPTNNTMNNGSGTNTPPKQ